SRDMDRAARRAVGSCAAESDCRRSGRSIPQFRRRKKSWRRKLRYLRSGVGSGAEEISGPRMIGSSSSVIAGVHPVREALRAGHALDRVLIARGSGGPRMQEIIDLCRTASIPVRFEARDALDRASNGAAHQGVIAYGAAYEYRDLE